MANDSSSKPGAAGESDYQRNLPAVIQPKRESWLGRTLRTWFGWRSTTLRADLSEFLDEAPAAETGFSPDESRMLKNILGLRERRLQDVMVPRADIIAVQQDIKLGELIRVFENAGHSRLVVYNDTLDDPIGMVHIRDVIAFMTAKAMVPPEKNAKRKKPFVAGLDLKTVDLNLPLSSLKIVREILFAPPSMRVMELLARMQATRIHLALVIDEYGGSDGLVSMEDIVEQIVGEIADEHDEAPTTDVDRLNDNSFTADARAPLEEVARSIGVDFDVADAAKEVDTLGGYLISRAGRVPVRGELVAGPGLYEIEVLDADPRRVKRVRIYKLKERRERPRERSRAAADTAVAASRPSSVPEAASTEPKSRRP